MQSGGLRTKGIKKAIIPGIPLISVITVVFNGEKTLEQTIQSVVNQTYENVEYIILDGASIDNTVNIIKKYESKIDYWQSEPDKGIYDAMNKGLELATGDFLLFLGADDVLLNSDVLKDFSSIISSRNYSYCYYGNVIRSQNMNRYDGKFSKFKIIQKNICQQAIFYSRNIYKTYRFNLKYKYLADYEYNIRVFSYMKYIDIDISLYNDNGISSVRIDNEFRRNIYSIVIKNMGLFYFSYLLLVKISRRITIILNKPNLQ